MPNRLQEKWEEYECAVGNRIPLEAQIRRIAFFAGAVAYRRIINEIIAREVEGGVDSENENELKSLENEIQKFIADL